MVTASFIQDKSYVRTAHLSRWSRLERLSYLFLVFAIIFLQNLLLLPRDTVPAVDTGFWIAFWIFVLMFALIMFFYAKRGIKAQKAAIGAEVKIRFSDKGVSIEVKSKTYQVSISEDRAWVMIAKIIEKRDYLYIYNAITYRPKLIPKSIFSKNQLGQIEKMYLASNQNGIFRGYVPLP